MWRSATAAAPAADRLSGLELLKTAEGGRVHRKVMTAANPNQEGHGMATRTWVRVGSAAGAAKAAAEATAAEATTVRSMLAGVWKALKLVRKPLEFCFGGKTCFAQKCEKRGP
jgi:hypothetical protein